MNANHLDDIIWTAFVYKWWMAFLSKRQLLLSLLLLLFVSEDDEKSTEDVDEVKEQINRVPDEVVVSTSSLLHNQLGVVQNESTEDEQTGVQVQLKHKLGSEEEIHESENGED